MGNNRCPLSRGLFTCCMTIVLSSVPEASVAMYPLLSTHSMGLKWGNWSWVITLKVLVMSEPTGKETGTPVACRTVWREMPGLASITSATSSSVVQFSPPPSCSVARCSASDMSGRTTPSEFEFSIAEKLGRFSQFARGRSHFSRGRPRYKTTPDGKARVDYRDVGRNCPEWALGGVEVGYACAAANLKHFKAYRYTWHTYYSNLGYLRHI